MKTLSQLTKVQLLELRSAAFDMFMDRYSDDLQEVVQEVLESMEIDGEETDENEPYLVYLGNAPTLDTTAFVPEPTEQDMSDFLDAMGEDFNAEVVADDHLDSLNDLIIECARDESALATRVLISYCNTHDLDPDGFKITWEDEAYVVSIAE